MSNEKVTQLPTVANATLADIIYAVQGGVSVQETLQQVAALFLANNILNFAGNPNGNVAGTTFQLCYNTTNAQLFVCTTSGSAVTAVWTLVGANLLLPANGGTGVANPTAHGIAVAEGSSNYTFKTLTNGQLLIGSTGADPVAGTITAGTGISIVNGAGSITISGTASAIGWNVVTTNQSMVADNGYIANAGGALTFTMPATAVVGTAIAVANLNSGSFTIAQNSGQNIRVGSSVTTTGVGGSIASTAQGDSIYLVCVVANTTWIAMGGVQGNLTIV